METQSIILDGIKDNFEDKAQEAANLVQSQINKQKWIVIKQKLKEISKLNLIKNLELQRFKNICIEIQGDKEVVYYRDGTLKGKRLVTFVAHNEAQIEGSEFKTKLLYF
jgi:hypothetical protein